MNILRNEEEGFTWAEKIIGGRIVRKEKHVRWRPQWFLDIELPDGTVRETVLRGFRNPGYTATDEKGARAWLAVETDILQALRDLPIKTPRLYGHNEDHGWMLMERVAGDAELTAVTDHERRFAIFQGYMEELARLHAYPLDKIPLPSSVKRPASPAQHRRDLITNHTAYYRTIERTQPEPIMELGLQWLADNETTSDRPLGLGLGDVGPNQFLFVEDRYHSLIDFEYGMIADPLMEISMMRVREMMYPIGRMPEHILHYGRAYEALTGIKLDIDALRYWSVAGPLLWNLLSVAGTNHPDPAMADTVFLLAWECQAQRGIVEAMAEYYGLRLQAPDIPAENSNMLTTIHKVMAGQIQHYYLPRAEDPSETAFVNYTAAVAQTLARGNVGKLDAANLEELASLLGHPVDDWYVGLYELERLIGEDYAHDLERRLNFLYRVQMRREHLYEPMQRATGCGSGSPLWRFDDVAGIAPTTVSLPASKTHVARPEFAPAMDLKRSDVLGSKA